MSQNINLFNPALRKERHVVTFNALAVCFAVVLLALLSVFYCFDRETDGVAQELRSADALLKAQRGYLEKLNTEAAARKTNAPLNAETAGLEAELKQAREAMDALKSGAIGSQQGFSEYLSAFSRQSVTGLWLTGLTIGGNGDIEIRGRTVSAELVPGYIQRLNREKLLAGRSFARLEMSQPKSEPDKGKDRDAKAGPRPARYLEFNLATADPAAAGKTP